MTDDLRNDLFARIEELESELRTRDNAEATHRITLREVQAETMRLQTKCDQLEADAMRYRWIRKKVGVDCDHISGAYVWLPAASYRLDEHDQRATDAAIDAAIAKENNQEELLP